MRATLSPPYLALLQAGFTMPCLLPATRCALTAPFHPYPAGNRPGGIFSVALSVGSRRPGITWRPAHVEPGLSSTVTALVEPGSHDSDCPADSHVHISPEWDDTPAIHTEAPEWRNSRGRLSNCMGVLYFTWKLTGDGFKSVPAESDYYVW